MVKKFWKLIFKEICDIFGKYIEFNAKIALLSNFDNVDLDYYSKELINNFLTRARVLIARFWKDKNDIKLEDWYSEVWDITLND